jgi:hypothetical protein
MEYISDFSSSFHVIQIFLRLSDSPKLVGQGNFELDVELNGTVQIDFQSFTDVIPFGRPDACSLRVNPGLLYICHALNIYADSLSFINRSPLSFMRHWSSAKNVSRHVLLSRRSACRPVNASSGWAPRVSSTENQW